ncbi:tetratricopeptide repeat protein [Kovacikia minuta CCNUW1]|uniref:Sll0314/Alr1548 family TPR repeat-containing protein n=1 Tax=Kovacikia minuta TaxID=2931930 RepID=UPI001CCB62A8|nr:Sll0314/Alr1548 family TPR repeat-containing protein [Kovacikia minuta]UBF27797.1 tetratricopeptide repeat protein [Kovacikia minuta CCNUW1]
MTQRVRPTVASKPVLQQLSSFRISRYLIPGNSYPIGVRIAPVKTVGILGAAIVSLSLWASPSLAKDPFRTTNARPISDRTEAAFKAFFEQGDYKAAEVYVKQADPNEPMTSAMKASLAYIDWQSNKDPQLLEQFQTYAAQTRDSAKTLLTKDPLRGNLYLAVGHFLQAGYAILKDGTVKGTPQGLGEVQQAFKYLDAAEKQDPNDPELNLVKGYIELLMALNLPFSSPTEAINRLDKHAYPRYLADRGIALGYRDLNQQTQALAAVDRALKATPDNPEVLYLKAQILVRQGNNKDGIKYFEQALKSENQLPAGLVKQIKRERDRAERGLSNVGP